MGTEYFLSNHKYKTIFELGKHWYFICDMVHFKENQPYFLYQEELRKHIISEYRETHLLEPDDNNMIEYIGKVSDKIFEFVSNSDIEKDIGYCNDCDDSLINLYEKGYVLVGSRYYINEPEKYTSQIIDDYHWRRSWYKNQSVGISAEALNILTPDFSIARFHELLIFA